MSDFSAFKAMQKKSWPIFASFEMFTGTCAPRLVSFAGVAAGQSVLDVGCGTAVAALSAARLGAHATGLDLTPELLARARENAQIMGLTVELNVVRERLGDAVTDVRFDRDVIVIPALSVAHLRGFLERNIAPVMSAVQMLGSAPEELAAFRKEFDSLLGRYFDPSKNALRQDYLLTRATKR